jgi:hypothetical protein
MDVWLGTRTVLLEAVTKCQGWLEDISFPSGSFEDTHGAGVSGRVEELPWSAAGSSSELQEELLERILALSQDAAVFMTDTPESTGLTPQQLSAAAGAMLEEDPRLRLLRFELVPRRVTEQRFWRRYFAAIAGIRRAMLPPGTADCGADEMASEYSSAAMPGPAMDARDLPQQEGQRAACVSPAATPHTLFVSQLAKTVSQVSGLAGGILWPPSAQSECTSVAAMAVDPAPRLGMPTGAAAAAAAAACPQQPCGGGAEARPSEAAQPGCGGSSGSSSTSAAAWQPVNAAAEGQSSGTRASPDGKAAAVQSSRSDVDMEAPDTSPTLRQGAAAAQPGRTSPQAAPAYAASAPPEPAAASDRAQSWTAAAPLAESSKSRINCSSSAAGGAVSSLQLHPKTLQRMAWPLAGGADEAGSSMDSDRDGSEWSHCSDHFMALSAALEAEEGDWEVL